MYRDVKRECLEPFRARAKYYPDYAEDDEQREKIEELVKCVEDYLDDYIKLSTGVMDDDEIDRFHKKVVEGLERAMETKEEQYRRAFEELDEVKEELEDLAADVCDKNSDIYDVDKCEEVQEKLENVERFKAQLENARKEDMWVLQVHLDKICKPAKTRKDKVLCIDSTFQLIHTRGTYLPLMCGAPLEEYVYQSVWGEDADISDPVGNAAVDLAGDTQDVLTCVKNYSFNKAHRQ